ncbi:hypothetical protein JYB64_06110 [Algoriphagus aestuarii]|nr:hypothetical protein [Algoriphagus aestuarii]
MENINEFTDQEKKERLERLIEITGLSYLGFGTFLELESGDKYIYALLNSNKKFSNKFIGKLEKQFKFKKGSFLKKDEDFNLHKINKHISKFIEENPDTPEYLKIEKEHISIIKFLIRQGYFSEKRTTKDIVLKFKELGYFYSSNDLSYKLVNLVTQHILKSKKTHNILKNGEKGNRPINIYWVED